jgi:hypothetical protein
MSYKGYRVKVNGVTIDNMMIVRGSYSMKREQRVIDSYYDAAGTLHEELSPASKAHIKFTVRDRSMEEQAVLLTAFSTGRNVTVQYFDDSTMDYNIGVFRVEDTEYTHSYAVNDRIRYGQAAIVLKEN